MVRGLIWLVIGIAVIIYNHSGADSRLVIRGTNFDFGYLILAFGLYYIIKAAVQSGRQASGTMADAAELIDLSGLEPLEQVGKEVWEKSTGSYLGKITSISLEQNTCTIQTEAQTELVKPLAEVAIKKSV